MKRVGFAILVGVVLSVVSPTQADASFGLSLTAGGKYGFLVTEPAKSRTLSPWGMNLELTAGYRFASIVTVDMGVQYDFLRTEVVFRPGARLHLGWFYLRLAIPLSLALQALAGEQFNLGILFGVGVDIRLGKWSILFEANVSPFFLELNNRGLEMPAEIRLGVGYSF